MKSELPTYSRYKPSGVEWVGEIPNSWEIWRLRFIAPLQGGFAFPSKDFESEGIAVVRMNNIKRGVLDLSDVVYVKKGPERFALKKGDLLLGMSGSIGETGSLGNYATVSESDLPCFLNQRVGRFEPKKKVGRDFIRYLVQSKAFTEPILLEVTGTAQFNISSAQVGNVRVALPDTKEQDVIVNFLDTETTKIDRLADVRRKQIVRLCEQRIAIIHHAVTKGLDADTPMKPSGQPWLESVPAHWEIVRLKFRSTINPSKGMSGYSARSDKEVVFLPMESVSAEGKIDQSNKGKIRDLWKGFTYFAKGDIVVAKITPCFENGKGALLSNLESEIGFGTTEFHVLRPGRKVLGEFLWWITSSSRFRGVGKQFMTGAAGQQRVSEKFLSDFPIALPPLPEQTSIVQHISTETKRIDALIAKYARELELLDEYRGSLISHAVTGKIDVRGLSNVPESTRTDAHEPT